MKHKLKPYIGLAGGIALMLAYTFISAQWSEETFIERDIDFGCSFLGMGDVNGDDVPDIAVGVNSSEEQAYVFSGSDGTFLFNLEADALSTDADSGCSLTQMGNINGESVVGDLTGDLVPEIAVAGESRQGQAFVFSGMNGELLYTLDYPNWEPQVDSEIDFPADAGLSYTFDNSVILGNDLEIAANACFLREKYVKKGSWRTLESFWNARGAAFFKAPAGARIKVRYGVGWFGKDRQKQTLNGYDYKKLDVGAWSVTYARMQMKLSSSTYVTYLVCPGGIGTAFPPIHF